MEFYFCSNKRNRTEALFGDCDTEKKDIYISMQYCSLCYGHQLLNNQHIRSSVHRSNINKLPDKWWLLDKDDLSRILKKKK